MITLVEKERYGAKLIGSSVDEERIPGINIALDGGVLYPLEKSFFFLLDDKIIFRANEIGEDSRALSGRLCKEFLSDMADLQCLIPIHQPRVTDHMEPVKNMIAQILSNGCAFAAYGYVYFSVDNFPNYGVLSGWKLEDNRAGEQVTVDGRKRNPADIALWKAAKAGEPLWDSPCGPGRPGWHIECSTMSAHYLKYSWWWNGFNLFSP